MTDNRLGQKKQHMKLKIFKDISFLNH